MGWFKHVFWGLAAAGGVYVLGVLTLTIPVIQRNATYAHNVNPTYFQNLSNVDAFGFIHHQVQPFKIKTIDGPELFAWHILPAHLYRKHEADLKAQGGFGLKPFNEAAKDIGLRLLLEDPSAIVVILFHGNAAHLASSYRPATYQQFLGTSTPERPVHVIAIDYRGFGLSSGTPTEAGVIQDGITVLSLLTGLNQAALQAVDQVSTAHLKPSQLILAGQSFGTFVSTAVYHYWTVQLGLPAPKALMIFASFTSLTKLLESYSIKGFTPPVLSPIAGYPWLQRYILSKLVDKWDTASRLTELVQSSTIPLDLTIMHSTDDWEIPWRESRRNWETVVKAVNGSGSLEQTVEPDVNTGLWRSDDGKKRVKWERTKHGGHNRIPVSEQAKVALLEVLDR